EAEAAEVEGVLEEPVQHAGRARHVVAEEVRHGGADGVAGLRDEGLPVALGEGGRGEQGAEGEEEEGTHGGGSVVGSASPCTTGRPIRSVGFAGGSARFRAACEEAAPAGGGGLLPRLPARLSGGRGAALCPPCPVPRHSALVS